MKVHHLSFFSMLWIQLAIALGGKILVFPMDGSHWVNMEIIIRALHSKGHEITVIREADSWYISEKSPAYTSVTIPSLSRFEETFDIFLPQQLELLLQSRQASLWSKFWNTIHRRRLIVHQLTHFHKKVTDLIIHMFEDENLMQSFRNAKYDLVLTDPGIGAGAMLARRLELPLVFNVRWTVYGEAHFLIAPSPLSYVPFTSTELTDKMTFPQRLKNVLSFSTGMYTLSTISDANYEPVVRKYFGPDVDYSTFFQHADIWLMRNDFIFEFPRPTLPNIVYIGGFQCKPSKPLPVDLEEFVQSSGDHGIIIMTLGTLIGKLPLDISEEIAAAFGQLPQKVIWRYTGQRPTNLGNNTLLVDWLPQNDLLGHSKIRGFVTHGGTNGVQEAIYHGVPVVGLPLFFDQPDNLFRLKAKGAAAIVDIAMLDRHIFAEALAAVLHNSTYWENMQKLSRLQRDQPVKPLDQAVFWIEYVIRHKGARHLQTQAHKMSWIVYNSVDVYAALLSAVLLSVIICIALIKYLWRILLTGRKVKRQ